MTRERQAEIESETKFVNIITSDAGLLLVVISTLRFNSKKMSPTIGDSPLSSTFKFSSKKKLSTGFHRSKFDETSLRRVSEESSLQGASSLSGLLSAD